MNSFTICIFYIFTFFVAFCYNKDIEVKTKIPIENAAIIDNNSSSKVWSLLDIQNKLSEQIKEIDILKEKLNNYESTVNNYKLTINNYETTIGTLQSTINDIKDNPIPINFIYIQFSIQLDPKVLWPTVEWKDVTSEYSGLFFRAEGNQSTGFGTIQEENSPRVTQVELGGDNSDHGNPITLEPNSWSKWIWTGSFTDNTWRHRFYTSGGEVRPRNTAIRIWKRTG